MEIASHVTRTTWTRADPDAVYTLLADVQRSVSHFPDIESIREERGIWMWRLRKLGAGPIQFQVSYGSRYHFDPSARLVWWEPAPGVGNTKVDGRWRIEPERGGTRFVLESSFALEAPFPRVLRGTVEGIVQKENERILGSYLANLVTTLEGGDGRVLK